MISDAYLMNRCIELARNGMGQAAPNPMVGAVVVHDGKIIGEGFHHAFGQVHAEVNAINKVIENGMEELLEKSTMYVNLEPCNHFGKTPPCTELIIRKKIPRVVTGCLDPFPRINGSGITRLKDAGIIVKTGILEKECLELNKRFITFHRHKRPYIILKYAQTSNHFLAPSGSGNRRISNDYTDILVHKWRSEESSIMVGTNTALIDNPLLTVRHWKGKNPLRIVIDRKCSLPENLNVFNAEAPTLVINEKVNRTDGSKEYIKTDFGNDLVDKVLQILYEKQVLSVLVEGGANLLSQFIEKKLWDEARIITSDKFFDDGIKSPEISGEIYESTSITGDSIVILNPHKK